jgi:hypothetical protein
VTDRPVRNVDPQRFVRPLAQRRCHRERRSRAARSARSFPRLR